MGKMPSMHTVVLFVYLPRANMSGRLISQFALLRYRTYN